MTNVSIEISDNDYERLVRLAKDEGKSVSEFVLDRLKIAMAERADADDLKQLETILDDRLRQAGSGKVSDRSVSDIFESARIENNG